MDERFVAHFCGSRWINCIPSSRSWLRVSLVRRTCSVTSARRVTGSAKGHSSFFALHVSSPWPEVERFRLLGCDVGGGLKLPSIAARARVVMIIKLVISTPDLLPIATSRNQSSKYLESVDRCSTDLKATRDQCASHGHLLGWISTAVSNFSKKHRRQIFCNLKYCDRESKPKCWKRRHQQPPLPYFTAGWASQCSIVYNTRFRAAKFRESDCRHTDGARTCVRYVAGNLLGTLFLNLSKTAGSLLDATSDIFLRVHSGDHVRA